MKKKVFREKYDDFIKWSEENGATKAIIFEPIKDGIGLEKKVIDIKPKKTTKKKAGK